MKYLPKSSLSSIAAMAIGVYLVVVLAQAVVHNYRLQKQIDDLNQQISLLTTQRDELASNLQFYQTNSFKDRQARASLGLQLPGESVIILTHPSNIAAQQAAQAPKPKPRSNWQQWLAFLQGKS